MTDQSPDPVVSEMKPATLAAVRLLQWLEQAATPDIGDVETVAHAYLSIVKARQVRGLTRGENAFVNSVRDRPVMEAIPGLIAIIEKLTTPTADTKRSDISCNAPPQMDHLGAAQFAAKLLEASAINIEASVHGIKDAAKWYRLAADHLRHYYVSTAAHKGAE